MKISIWQVLLFLSLSSCKAQQNLNAELPLEEANIAVTVTDIKPNNTDNTSFVYGSLVINGQKTGKANLTCISISLDGLNSENIYVDSVAHILPNQYPLEKEQTKIPVYWKMNAQIKEQPGTKKLAVFLKSGCKL